MGGSPTCAKSSDLLRKGEPEISPLQLPTQMLASRPSENKSTVNEEGFGAEGSV